MPPELATPETLSSVSRALEHALEGFVPSVRVRREGHVVSCNDAIVRIVGLPDARAEEIVRIGDRHRALVLSLERGAVDAIVLDGAERISVGDGVRTTGQLATIGVGDALIGRVVDALGRPLDGLPLAGTPTRMPLERRAPRIHERAAVHLPLHTGVLAVDAMLPIGRGQRELILGDEGTGKTALALDAMVRQRDTDVVSIYVAIGRRRSETWQIVETLRQRGGRWIVVAAPEDESPGMRYLVPYAGTAVAEYFAQRGEHALVVYDELSAHAVAWRELSLLLRRPPGREAYPGDIFHLHSRLLERSAQLSSELGGGSITALPLATLEGGRLTGYIPTNLISITDGQIVLSQALFSAGHKPAIDAALSVSRIGAKAQPDALRELAGRMRLDYATFLELEAFSRIGARLETTTQRRIDLGRRIRALLRAERLEPLGVFDEVVRLLLASDHELLLRVAEPKVLEIAQKLTEIGRRDLPHVHARVERDGLLLDSDRRELEALMKRHLPGSDHGD